MIAQIQIRRGTTAEWAASNAVLASGEPGFDTTLERMKIGNGTDSWDVLPWANADVFAPIQASNIEITDTAEHYATANVEGALAEIGQRVSGIVNVMSYGATGDGVTDDRAAVVAAIAALGAAGGVVFFPPGTYLFGSGFTVPAYVTLLGSGQSTTILKRGFEGDFITSSSGYISIEKLKIDGDCQTNHPTWTGRGVYIPNANSNSIRMLFVTIWGFLDPCLEFGNNSGRTSFFYGCVFYTTAPYGTSAAVKMGNGGSANDMSPSTFVGCESAGCTLYDFGSASDVSITGGYTIGLIFGTDTVASESYYPNKIYINNMRWGSIGTDRQAIYGESHQFTNIMSSPKIDLKAHHCSISIGVTGNDIQEVAPGAGDSWTIGSNSIDVGPQAYTCAWSAETTQPDKGNGSIFAQYVSMGRVVRVNVKHTFGSTTTYGTGTWYYSLPRPEITAPGWLCGEIIGSGVTVNTGADITFNVRMIQGSSKVALIYNNAGTLAYLDSASKSWGAGDILHFTYEYVTA